MNLLAGKIIPRHKVNLIPITQEVIYRVEVLSKKMVLNTLWVSKIVKREKFARMIMKMMTMMVQYQKCEMRMKSNMNQI